MTGRFLKVKCAKCSNEQNIYEKASIPQVNCLVCGEALATATGGKTALREGVKVLKVLD